MTAEITIDGRACVVKASATIKEAAAAAGVELPSLCNVSRQGFRSIATCRMCLVEVEGEKNLAAACRRQVESGMSIVTRSERLDRVRRLVAELTLSEQAEGASQAHSSSRFNRTASAFDAAASRFGQRPSRRDADYSHPAIAVDFDACIRCEACREACQTVQVNGVIGFARRGRDSSIVFDLDKPLAESSCVSCGECVQVCPTGALSPNFGLHTPLGAAPTADRAAQTVCPFCSVGCRVELHFSENRLLYATGAEGPANHGRLCVKGRFGFDFLQHPDRLRTPLVRRDHAPKDASLLPAAEAMAAYFRPASWDEALARAAEGFRRIKSQNGTAALAVLGSGKASNEDAYVTQKLGRAVFGNNNIDHCTRLCASVPPLTEAIGFTAVTAPVEQVFSTDVILMVGSNPDVNHPVAASFIKNAVRAGKKLILVDPHRQRLSRFATHHLQLRPGTDVALLSAMARVIIAEGLVDRSFVAARVEGFAELAARVESYTLETVERICGVSAESIVQAARTYATAPRAMTFWGMGASQHTHGADNIRCAIALALITGRVGEPGSGLHPLRGQNNVQGSCDAGLLPMAAPGYRPFTEAREDLGRLWNVELPVERGLTVMETIDAAERGDVRGLYVVGGNPVMANPDLAQTRRALSRLEHLVVQDIFPTETAIFADVILPSAALAERRGSVTNTDRIVQWLEPVLPPPGDAKPDYWIVTEIARRLGSDWVAEPEAIFDEMAAVTPILQGFTASKLREAGWLQYPLANGGVVEPSLFGNRFPTAGGRAHLAAVSDPGPAELPDDDFPLVLMTGREIEHWHTGTMTRRSRVLDSLSQEATVRVAPKEFAALGLTEGQPVGVETRRGRVTAVAVCDEGLQPGLISMPFSYFEAAGNELTSSSLDPTTRVPAYKYCAARLVS